MCTISVGKIVRSFILIGNDEILTGEVVILSSGTVESLKSLLYGASVLIVIIYRGAIIVALILLGVFGILSLRPSSKQLSLSTCCQSPDWFYTVL